MSRSLPPPRASSLMLASSSSSSSEKNSASSMPLFPDAERDNLVNFLKSKSSSSTISSQRSKDSLFETRSKLSIQYSHNEPIKPKHRLLGYMRPEQALRQEPSCSSSVPSHGYQVPEDAPSFSSSKAESKAESKSSKSSKTQYVDQGPSASASLQHHRYENSSRDHLEPGKNAPYPSTEFTHQSAKKRFASNDNDGVEPNRLQRKDIIEESPNNRENCPVTLQETTNTHRGSRSYIEDYSSIPTNDTFDSTLTTKSDHFHENRSRRQQEKIIQIPSNVQCGGANSSRMQNMATRNDTQVPDIITNNMMNDRNHYEASFNGPNYEDRGRGKSARVPKVIAEDLMNRRNHPGIPFNLTYPNGQYNFNGGRNNNIQQFSTFNSQGQFGHQTKESREPILGKGDPLAAQDQTHYMHSSPVYRQDEIRQSTNLPVTYSSSSEIYSMEPGHLPDHRSFDTSLTTPCTTLPQHNPRFSQTMNDVDVQESIQVKGPSLHSDHLHNSVLPELHHQTNEGFPRLRIDKRDNMGTFSSRDGTSSQRHCVDREDNRGNFSSHSGTSAHRLRVDREDNRGNFSSRGGTSAHSLCVNREDNRGNFSSHDGTSAHRLRDDREDNRGNFSSHDGISASRSSSIATPILCNKKESKVEKNNNPKGKNVVSILKDIRAVMEMRQKAKHSGDFDEVEIFTSHLEILNNELKSLRTKGEIDTESITSLATNLHSSESGEQILHKQEYRNASELCREKKSPLLKEKKIKIRAPADLKAGYEFSAAVQGEIIKAIVPYNVKKGEIFSIESPSPSPSLSPLPSTTAVKKETPKSILKRKIKVRAPEDLPEGYEFITQVKGKTIRSVIPKGGVRKGDIISVPYIPDN